MQPRPPFAGILRHGGNAIQRFGTPCCATSGDTKVKTVPITGLDG
jgi:hypothetical protein